MDTHGFFDFDKRQLLQLHDPGTQNPCSTGPGSHTDRNDQTPFSRIQVSHQKNGQRKAWHCHGDIGDGCDDLICHPSEITGYQSKHGSHTGHDKGCKNTDIKGNSGAIHHLGKNILSHIIRS